MKTEFILARANGIRISPSKLKLAADLVRGKVAKKSIAMLKLMPKKACELLAKLVSSAVANATQKKYDPATLIISKIDVGRGPMSNRFMPRAKGRSCSITKYTSNLIVYLSGEKLQTVSVDLGGEDLSQEESING